MTGTAYPAAQVFDGRAMHEDAALLVEQGRVVGICARAEIPNGSRRADPVALITPGFVDLQVNGGGGIMFNDSPDLSGLGRIAAAHLGAGTTALLPTLVTDTPEVAEAAVAAVAQAAADGMAGILGLHLEGPHFSPARKGAHRGDLVRPMTQADLAFLCEAAARVPLLKVTLSPEVVSLAQIAALTKAGVLVSLGHSDASFAECEAAFDAGARCVTHLFNAMSQITGREPGLVGAALTQARAHVGVIADGHHVHPANLLLAARCLVPTERLFLVTDAMAPFGTDQARFLMNGREVRREAGTLRLSDGTLAGADLTLPEAVANLVRFAKLPLETALRMVTAIPAHAVAHDKTHGALGAGARADFLTFGPDLALQMVFRAGQKQRLRRNASR